MGGDEVLPDRWSGCHRCQVPSLHLV
jgi:hypothetical protein